MLGTIVNAAAIVLGGAIYTGVDCLYDHRYDDWGSY